MSWWRFAERRRSRDATPEDVVKWSARYRGAMTVKTAAHHDTHLVSDPLWHIQPMKLIVELGVTSGYDQTSVLKFCKLLYLSLQHLTWKYTVYREWMVWIASVCIALSCWVCSFVTAKDIFDVTNTWQTWCLPWNLPVRTIISIVCLHVLYENTAMHDERTVCHNCSLYNWAMNGMYSI